MRNDITLLTLQRIWYCFIDMVKYQEEPRTLALLNRLTKSFFFIYWLNSLKKINIVPVHETKIPFLGVLFIVIRHTRTKCFVFSRGVTYIYRPKCIQQEAFCFVRLQLIINKYNLTWNLLLMSNVNMWFLSFLRISTAKLFFPNS